MVLLEEGRVSNILDPPHYAGWYPADPSSIPKSTQELWLSRPSTPLVDPDVFSRRRNFVESDLHVLLVDADKARARTEQSQRPAPNHHPRAARGWQEERFPARV